jgi:hypothetical protein
MTQTMNAVAMLDACPLLRLIEDFLGGGHRQVTTGPSPFEHPGLGTVNTPIGAQFLQQSRRKQGVAVLVSLALIDADEHPFGVNITRL